MLKITLVGVDSSIRRLTQQVASETALLAQTVFTEVKKRTPVDTGRARSGWTKQVQKDRFTIENQVPYITVLDKGRSFRDGQMRGSKQAPKGIVGPSLNSIKGKN